MSEHPIRRAVRRLTDPQRAGVEPDTVLLDRWAREADHSAFELLVWRYGAMVLATCRRVLPPTDAEDAFQATFFALARKAASVGRSGSLGGWLHRVAVHTCRAARRRTAARPLPLTVEPEAPAAHDTHELRAVLDEELDRLPERFRRVLVICYLQEKTAEEAAVELGCPRGTVLSRLLRGRERLRARLSRRGLALPATVAALALAGEASAALPAAQLVGSTVTGASSWAVGGTAGGSASVPAAQLAREVLNAMRMNAVMKLVMALVVAGCGLGVGLNWPAAAANGFGQQLAGDPPPVNAVRPAPPAGGAKPAEKPDPKKELEKLKGEWQVASLEMGGEKVPEAAAQKMSFTFGTDKVTLVGKLAQAGGTFVVNDGSSEFGFTIDPAKKVAEIDIEIKDKEFANGIYKFDGDDLILCVDYSRADRPVKFETKDNPAHALYRLKKAK